MSNPIEPAEAFDELGRITRQLHEALSHLGLHGHLERVVTEIPDARDRLSYVGQMTEDAANKVLNLVDTAKPQCEAIKARAEALTRSLEAGAPAAEALPFARDVAAHEAAQAEVLTSIMMAQDFQDLSGQVIKKVIDIISRTEAQLVQLLVKTASEESQVAIQHNELAGPQVPDKALKQDDVDDLLASLGF